MAKIEALGYVVAEATDVSKWKQYAEQVLGATTAPTPGGGLDIKLDDRAYRITVIKGAADRYYASGWEVPDEASFSATVDSINKSGTKIVIGDAKLKDARAAPRGQRPAGRS